MKTNCKEVPHETDSSFSVAEQITFKRATELLKEESQYVYFGKYDDEDGFESELERVEDLGHLFDVDDKTNSDYYIIRHFERLYDENF